MPEKILIFGNGQMGNMYKNFFIGKGIEAEISKADITQFNEVKRAISQFKPAIVINTAAWTNLERCEADKLNCFNVNVLGAGNVAKACDEAKIYFIHLSSGCIFESKDENDLRKEDDLPAPAAYYSYTTAWAEQYIKYRRSSDFRYLILRPRQPVSAQVSPKNMLVKFLTFVSFVETPNTGTVLEDLMDWTLELIKIKPVGVLHVANEGWTTPYDIALLLKKHVLPDLPAKKIAKAELDKIVPNRRVDTVLDVSKLKGLGINVAPFRQRVEDIVKSLGENIRRMDNEELKQILKETAKTSKQRTAVNSCWPLLFKKA